ncbi:hypothetical protein ACFOM8_09845 [Paracoccus angustae]|uniref:Acyltransferase 3 domain-containing protein n=1 Tax=Paracoccus angustae TaxID=1671480 RepID=A0ABV7U3V0_9RHOB
MADCSFRRRRYYGQVFSGRWTVAFLKDGLAPFYCQTLIHNWFIVKIPEVTGAMPMHGTGAHFWSIAVEEQFYLIAPLLLVLIPLRHSILAWGLLTAAAIADQASMGRFRRAFWRPCFNGGGAIGTSGLPARRC